jgi:hypothetical protein
MSELPFDNEMRVVRHVAVRTNDKCLIDAHAHNLLVRAVHGVRAQQQARSFERAKRQEIMESSDVLEMAKVMRVLGHPRVPEQTVRLTADAHWAA